MKRYSLVKGDSEKKARYVLEYLRFTFLCGCFRELFLKMSVIWRRVMRILAWVHLDNSLEL